LETDPHGALVGATSAAYGDVLVAPGDPDGSLLMRKLDGTMAGDEGGPMPPTSALDPARLEVVRGWIEAGADAVCDTTTDPTVQLYHPDGWAAPELHGLAAKLQQDDCRSCHGEDLGPDGGTVGISCGSCHDAVTPDWATTCTFCHGDPAEGSGAPPQDIDDVDDPAATSFPQHLAHVQQTELHVAWGCEQCHAEPSSALDPGHVFVDDDTAGVAEVTFDGGIAAGGDYDGAACGVYCHTDGKGTPVAPVPDVICGACHSVKASLSKLSGRHLDHLSQDDLGGITCVACHDTALVDPEYVIDPAKLDQHVDGAVQVVVPAGMAFDGAGCTGTCHEHAHLAPDNQWFSQ
ncbi:MAG: hypothetical protein ABMA64_16360, partial [Myxococcota bacterium]